MRIRGFTLIEVMISVSISLLLVVLATTAFLRLERLVRRTQARLDMHGSMRFVHANLGQDLTACINGSAMFLTARPSAAAAGDPPDARVCLVFMRGRLDPQDFPLTYLDNGAHFTDASDLTWVEWRWDQRRRQLLRGVNRSSRQFTSQAPLNFGTPYDYSGRRFLQMPQPRRDATGGPDTGLNQNSWNTGSPDDLGDRQDLEQQMTPMVGNVTACTFQVVPQDGSAPVTADGSVQVPHLPLLAPPLANPGYYNGAYVDGTGMPADRPAIVRMLIEITDPTTHLVQTFSWSFQVPGLLPALTP